MSADARDLLHPIRDDLGLNAGCLPNEAEYLRGQVARLKERYDAERRDRDGVAAELERLRGEHGRLAAGLEALGAQLAAVRAEHTATRAECASLWAERQAALTALHAVYRSRGWRTIHRVRQSARWLLNLVRRRPAAPAPDAGPAVAAAPPTGAPRALADAPAGGAVPVPPAPPASAWPPRFPDRVGGPRVPSLRSFRVLFIIRPGTYDAACMRYRGYNVIEGLRQVGIEADPMDELHLPDRLAEALCYDLIVLIRRQYTPKIAALLNAAEQAGVPVACDLDDYIFEEQAIPHSSYLASQAPAQALETVARWGNVVARCAYYTAPTTFLVERATALGRQSVLVRNALNDTQIALSRLAMARAERDEDEDEVRIGYFSGSNTHQNDFRVIAPTLVRLMDEFPNVALFISGDFNLAEFSEFAKFGGRVRARPFVDWTLLPDELVQVDINIAPLEMNPFTEAKSSLKFFEAAAVKVPVVATPTRPFTECIRHGVNGYLASTPDEWYQALRDLIADPELRRQVGERAHQDALAEFCPKVLGDEARAAYRRMLLHHRRRLGVGDQVATVVLVVGDLARAVRDRSPALTLAADLKRLGAEVTIVVPGGAGGVTAAGADRLIADHFLEPLCAVEVGGEIPCCDLLIAADPAAAHRVGLVRHRACQAAYVVTEYDPLHLPPGAGRDEAAESYELGLDLFTFDAELAELLARRHDPRVRALPAWLSTQPLAPASVQQPETVLVAGPSTLPNRTWAEVVQALRATVARHPLVRVIFAGPVADRAAGLDLPHRAVSRLHGAEFEAALAERPLCVALYPSARPLWVYDLMARGCPVIAVPGGVRTLPPVSDSSAGHLTVPADAGALAQAIESLLIDRIRLTALMVRAAESVQAMPDSLAAAQAFLLAVGPLVPPGSRVRPFTEAGEAYRCVG